ncbi:MAG TPA: hypothetical protein VIC58_00785 [Actinomycetota bacterium]
MRGFEVVLASVERAREALTEAVPGTRMPGRPLAEAIAEFDDRLHEARSRMNGWHVTELEEEWARASSALDESLSRAEHARVARAEPGGFEGLIGLVDELLAPLEAFRDASDRFRELRA